LTVEASGSKDIGHELCERIPQGRDLMWESEYLRPTSRIPLVVQPREDSRVQASDQFFEFGHEALCSLPFDRLVVRERHAPYLCATLLIEIVEGLREAGHQVALGDHEING